MSERERFEERFLSEWCRDSADSYPRDIQNMWEAWQAALEQHHKDLMGLAETWSGPDALALARRGQYEAAACVTACADQLSSLINPKD